MSATDELRRMLDERGVEWTKPSGLNERYANELTFIGDHAVVSEIDGSDLLRINFDGTPEQAIAATLGHYNAGRYVGLCQGEYWERTENGDYYCGGCGWKVTDHDSYCPECGGALHEYALGEGTCRMVFNEKASGDELYPTEVFNCSKCGEWVYTGKPNYCPDCGRKVEG